MNKVDIFVGGQRLDLFQDEQITINVTIQNVQDISKVFNDYTQSFTIPASPRNNQILEHYYRTDIDGVLDFRLRVDAFIEMNSAPFKQGVIQLESVQLKGAEPYAYMMSFYGSLTSLSDTFGEDELSDLNLAAYNHAYTSANVRTGLQTGLFSGNVIYPLMSPKKNWYIDTGANHQDDSNIAYHTNNDPHGIHYYELKPAIKVARLIDAIEAKYGVNFGGSFLSDATFNKLYLWAHHVEGYMYEGKTATMPYQVVNFTDTNFPTPDWFNLTTDTFTPVGTSGSGNIYDVSYSITPVGYTGQYYVAVLINGLVWAENIHQGAAAATFAGVPVTNNVGGLQLAIRPAQQAAMSFDADYLQIINLVNSGVVTDVYTTTSQSYNQSQVNMSTLMPKMKIKDFINGLIKMHNLVVEYVEGVYRLSTLDAWYAAGSTIQIDQFVDVTEMVVSRLPLYKAINFKYQPTDQILGKQYFEQNGVQWGTLEGTFPFNGNETLDIDAPFELPMFEKLVDIHDNSATNVLVYKSITKEADDQGNFNAYIGSPVLFYAESGLTLNHQINLVNADLTNAAVSSVWYCNISSSKTFALAKTLAWGAEIDPYHLKTITKSLYQEYWANYIGGLYNPKKRLVTCKAVMPLIRILKFKLNDTLLWRGEKWRINSAGVNMNTGVVELELINEVGTASIVTGGPQGPTLGEE